MFDAEFFPTPNHIAHRMVAKVSARARYFLEPSAGKGDLAEAIKSRFGRADIDCIETSPDLALILTGKGFNVVGYDWLDYAGVSYYDAILMNPPFSNGDAHLLGAWDFLHHGEIVCLLNAETLRNPHTAARKRLAGIIAAHGSVELLGDCFRKAERQTGVEVVMVHLTKAADDDLVDLWATDTAEREQGEPSVGGDNMLAVIDKLGNMQHYYDKANEHMLQGFAHIRKAAVYLAANKASADWPKIIPLALGNVTEARAEFLRQHRRSAWMMVFEQMEFRNWLDKKQTAAFIREIERTGNIPFTAENIRGTLQNVFLQRNQLFETSVSNVFDMLTNYFKGNTNHTEGWKSNDGYKVNQKIVFPYGCSYEGRGTFGYWSAYHREDIYTDIDRVLCVLDGKSFAKCVTIGHALRDGFKAYETAGNRCESDYFSIRFFKKGTVHLTWKRPDLRQAFNVSAAKGKAWIGRDQKAA